MFRTCSNFFLPRKTKQVLAESELIQSNLRRNRIYAQDILSAKDLEIILALEEAATRPCSRRAMSPRPSKA